MDRSDRSVRIVDGCVYTGRIRSLRLGDGNVEKWGWMGGWLLTRQFGLSHCLPVAAEDILSELQLNGLSKV